MSQEASGASSPRWASQSPRVRTTRAVQNFVLIFLSIGIVALYSSYRRPIWLDEFFQFAWGSYEVEMETMFMIFRSTRDFNLGQTGVYMILDTFLLNIFGANSLVLRLPSLVVALLMLTSVVFFFKLKGFGIYWQVIALLAFGAQTYLMYYAGEARPYMPLAASTVGLATYYSTPIEIRQQVIPRLIGWTSAVLGSLLHPYVLLYAVLLACVFFVSLPLSNRKLPTVRSLIPSVNPALLSTIVIISVGLASIGWGQNRRDFELNPFQWHSRENLKIIFTDAHFVSLPFPNLGFNFLAALILIAFIILPLTTPPPFPDSLSKLIAPLSLILAGLLATLILIAVSFYSGFWILSRQWLGSMALVTLGLVWYLACAQRLLFRVSRRGSLALTFFVTVIFLYSFSERSYQQILKLKEYSIVNSTIEKLYKDVCASSGSSKCSLIDVNEADMNVTLSQLNIVQGGPVWVDFREFYERYRNPIK